MHADDGLDLRHEGGRDRGAERGQEQEGKGGGGEAAPSNVDIFCRGRSDVHADDGLDVCHEGGRDRGAKRGQEQEGKGHREGETTSLNEARILFHRFWFTV